MNAWRHFWEGGTAAHPILAICIVAAVGLALSKLQFRKVGLGVAGVLFAGLAAARSGVRVDAHVLEFVREFGLILFVFSIGLQLGPGFFASLRRAGLRLNSLAAFNVLAGVATCAGIYLLFDLPLPIAAGLLSGATTNTPSLAAAQQALAQTGADTAALASQGVAYALAYPFGVCGVILAMLLARFLLPAGRELRPVATAADQPAVQAASLRIDNPAACGRTLSEVFGSLRGLTVSRLHRDGTSRVPPPDIRLQQGDLIHVVGGRVSLDQARLLAGADAQVDLRSLEGPILNRRLIVTHREAIGKSLAALQLRETCGAAPTRVARHGLEFPPEGGLRLQFGDVVTLVGTEEAIAESARLLGDSPKELEHTRVGPLFFGILLGVLLGMLPLAIPGIPAPVKLGLAGGPLIVAILLSRIGSIGPVVWYVPYNASLALREIGIVLFLACVGLKSGDLFFQSLASTQGLVWIGLGASITFLPILLTSLLARSVLKMPLPETCGLLAGSMTDPPALAFAQRAHEGTSVSVAYVTVYPLVMLLRVISAQLLVFLLV